MKSDAAERAKRYYKSVHESKLNSVSDVTIVADFCFSVAEMHCVFVIKSKQFLYCLCSRKTLMDHFVHRLSSRLTVLLSVHLSVILSHKQATHMFLGTLVLYLQRYFHVSKVPKFIHIQP